MSLGNMLPVIEDKFGVGITADGLRQLYHTDELTPYLPDGCCWLAKATDGDVTELEAVKPSELPSVARIGIKDAGGIVIIDKRDDGSDRTDMIRFPECDLASHLPTASPGK